MIPPIQTNIKKISKIKVLLVTLTNRVIAILPVLFYCSLWAFFGKIKFKRMPNTAATASPEN